MKKAFILALLLVSTFSFNGFAQEEVQEEVTGKEVLAAGSISLAQLAAFYAFLRWGNDKLAPADKKSPHGIAYSTVMKTGWGVFCVDQIKTFFQKLKAYSALKAQPFTAPALDTISNLV